MRFEKIQSAVLYVNKFLRTLLPPRIIPRSASLSASEHMPRGLPITFPLTGTRFYSTFHSTVVMCRPISPVRDEQSGLSVQGASTE